MSENVDAFKKAVSIKISDHIVQIKSRTNARLKFVVYLAGLFVISIFISIQGINIGLIFLVAVFGTVAYLAYQEIKISLYPLTILDLKKKSVLRKSLYLFIKPKSYSFRHFNGISMSVQAVGGYTSAYEDDTTDFEKTILLETETGDVPLLNFISRKEEAEESLTEFLSDLKEKLIRTNKN